MKTWTTIQPGLQSKPTLWMTSQPRNPLELRRGKLDSGKTQTKIRLMRTMLRNRRTAHQELCNHEDFLTKLCGKLIKTIQDTDDSSALKVRVMLQQQDVFTTIADTLEYSNKKKLHQMTCELQEWEEKEESKIHNLEQQVEQLDAKIEKVRKKVSFVSTYMDRAPLIWTSSSTSLWKSCCPSRWRGHGPPVPPWSHPHTQSLEFSRSKTTSPFRPWSAGPSFLILPPSLLSFLPFFLFFLSASCVPLSLHSLGWCCYLSQVGIPSQVLFTNKAGFAFALYQCLGLPEKPR
ncbi:uncharacterized protein C20orf96 homolog isoform X3 [Kogia breviceps]|uniref:uncharacterized protein C20orf96 homolog isoform X3 n=1 Tax=Kogia breviceps TaxID=27615 RepID=UPI0034D2D85E